MAFDKWCRLQNNGRTQTHYAWGEFVVSPVIVAGVNTTTGRGTVTGAASGSLIIRVHYDPRILTFSPTRVGFAYDWVWLQVAGFEYVIEGFQIIDNYKTIEITCVSGRPST